MDLLKDITRGLRNSDESATDGRSRSPPADRTDAVRPGATDDSPGDDSSNDDQSRADTHVCSFCETEFDADRRACPDCGAEIVFRGER